MKEKLINATLNQRVVITEPAFD